MEQFVLKPFKRTKHTPLDESFNIDSIQNIDSAIPYPIRYEGLIFFAITENLFYYFDTDLTTPKVLNLSSNETESLIINEGDYNNIEYVINQQIPTPTLGQLVYLSPLNIIIGYNGTNWVYICGEYHLSDITYFNQLPNNFKQRKVRVLDTTNTVYYIVGENGGIRDLYRVFSTMPLVSDIEDGEIFTYTPNIQTLRVFIKTQNTFVELTTTVILDGNSYIESNYTILKNDILFNQGGQETQSYTTNVISHNLDSVNVKVWCLCNSMKIEVGVRYIDNNTIQLLSATTFSNCIIIVESLLTSNNP